MHEPIFSQASTPRLLTAGCDVEDEEEEGQLLAPVPELDPEKVRDSWLMHDKPKACFVRAATLVEVRVPGPPKQR